MRSSPIWLCCVLALSAAGARAQCPDPPAPSLGFALRSDPEQLITYSDAYRTCANVVYPTAPPGPCGWPLVVLVHGLTASKNGQAGEARRLARHGFFVVTYDVRGQGSGIKLNPGRGFKSMSVDEYIDMAEIIEWAIRTYPTHVDGNRVGVSGFSQGGTHSWAAAALSGRLLVTNPRRSTPFPVIKAAVPIGFEPFFLEAASLGGTAFNNVAGRGIYYPIPGIVYEPALGAATRPFFERYDPRGWYQYFVNDPGRDFRPQLAQTAVPVLCIISWLDSWGPANGALAGFDSLPASTPKRLVCITGHHRSAKNTYLKSVQDAMRIAWMRRFLKGWPEPVEAGPAVLAAAMPPDGVTYRNASSRWRLRADSTFPPADATTLTYHLRASNALSTAPPPAPELPDRIQHRIPQGYDMQSWHDDGSGRSPSSVATILTKLPLSEAIYTSPSLARDTEIAGPPVFRAHVTPTVPDFLLAARLEAVDPGGNAQVLSIGARGQYGAAGAVAVRFEMDPIDTVLPAGWRLRLRVRNHHISQPRTDEYFRTMPFFTSCDLDLAHSPGATSALDLWVRPAVRLGATLPLTELSLASPQPLDFQLRSSSLWQGLPYALLASFTAQGPPLVLPGGEALYLVPDALTHAVLSAPSSPSLSGFVGVLDGQGAAQARLDLSSLAPVPASLLGLNMHFAPVAVNGSRLEPGAPLFVEWR